MLESLKEKWGVGPVRVFLILVTFALGGSLTGLLSRKIMSPLEIDSIYLYIPIYIILVTILWPVMVLLVSLPLGQFFFFRSYIRRIANKIARK
jgi:predicted neutral ceramidase superfamily lipid hydrolase